MNSVPMELERHFPEELSPELVRRTQQLEALTESCETIIALEGRQVRSDVFESLHVSKKTLEINNRGTTVYARAYRSVSGDHEKRYGFFFAPTDQPSSNYDGYALIRIEKGGDGSYSLIAGGAGSDPTINDTESITFLSQVCGNLAEKLVTATAERKKFMQQRIKIVAGIAASAFALVAAGPKVVGFFDGEGSDITKHKNDAISVGQSMEPILDKHWTKRDIQAHIKRVTFSDTAFQDSECKQMPIQSDKYTRILAVTDYSADTGGPKSGLQNEFSVHFEPNNVEVCWQEGELPLVRSTSEPTVGILITK